MAIVMISVVIIYRYIIICRAAEHRIYYKIYFTLSFGESSTDLRCSLKHTLPTNIASPSLKAMSPSGFHMVMLSNLKLPS